MRSNKVTIFFILVSPCCLAPHILTFGCLQVISVKVRKRSIPNPFLQLEKELKKEKKGKSRNTCSNDASTYLFSSSRRVWRPPSLLFTAIAPYSRPAALERPFTIIASRLLSSHQVTRNEYRRTPHSHRSCCGRATWFVTSFGRHRTPSSDVSLPGASEPLSPSSASQVLRHFRSLKASGCCT